MKNTKTTALGIVTALIAVLSMVQNFLTGEQLQDLATHIAAITAGVGLLFARDAKDEQ